MIGGLMRSNMKIHRIWDDDFYVDIENARLTEVKNINNHIEFKDMSDKKTHYNITYDLNEKNLYRLKFPEIIGEDGQIYTCENLIAKKQDYIKVEGFVNVNIPPMYKLDYNAMVKLYGLPTNEMSDFNFIVNEDLLQQRLLWDGYTQVKIGNYNYRPANGSLIPEWKDYIQDQIININKIDEDDNGNYRVMYDPYQRKIIPIDENKILEIPKHYFVIELPHYWVIDPVGYALMNDRDLKYTLRSSPLLKSYEVTIIPFDETLVAEYIERNKTRQKIEAKSNIKGHSGSFHKLSEYDWPIYNLHGTDFFVDVHKYELREKENIKNKISFRRMSYKGTHYEFFYNLIDKNVPGGASMKEYNVFTKIPELKTLDPLAMSILHNINEDVVHMFSDFQILYDQKAVNNRINGELPVVEIMGFDFLVDEKKGYIQDLIKTTTIEFDNMGVVRETCEHCFAYNPITHQQVELDEFITEVPAGLFWIIIPNVGDLDPIGFAINHELDIKEYAMAHYPQKVLVGKIVPWEETFLLDDIKENREKLQRANAVDQSHLKNSNKKKRSNHL